MADAMSQRDVMRRGKVETPKGTRSWGWGLGAENWTGRWAG